MTHSPSRYRFRAMALASAMMLVGSAPLAAWAVAQPKAGTLLSFLDGRGSVLLPDGEAHELHEDSLLAGSKVTSGIHNFYFRSYTVRSAATAEAYLAATAKRRAEIAPSDVTVNLDRIVCDGHNGVDLTHWMWHPRTKPQGLLLSKDRMFIVENLFILMTVEGNEASILEPVADEYLNSVRYLGESLCMN